MAAILFLKFFLWMVNMNYHTKSGNPSLKFEWVMINFVFWQPFCFWRPSCFWEIFLQRVNINFHSKFWSSSLKNVWAMINFVFLVAILFLGQFCLGSIWTSMLKFVLLAWKLNDVWSILCFGGHLVFGQKISDIFVEGLTT